MSHFCLRHSFNILLCKNVLTKYAKNKARTILWEKRRKYDLKIETVKHFELIAQNKIWLIFNTTPKVCKFPGHASSHSIFIIIFTVINISKVQTLKFRTLKFDQNCSYIGGLDTYPLQSVAIFLNLAVRTDGNSCTYEKPSWKPLQNRQFCR